MKGKMVCFLKKIIGFGRSKEGKIRLVTMVDASGEITFHVNAANAYVEWGDGANTEIKEGTICFRHRYLKAGNYEVIICGDSIVDIDVKKCNIVSLNLNECETLEFIDCSDNQLTELDVRNCKGLYELYCSDNHLNDLKLDRYHKLFYLSCSNNNLSEIKLKGCRNLVNLHCSANQLRNLDVSYCRKLASVNIEDNVLDRGALKRFLLSLIKRPYNDVGFVVLRNNQDSLEYDERRIFRNKGWHEI